METISFARGGLAPECLPEEELADCAETVIKRDGKTLLSYGSGAGYTPLRELIGQWFGVHPFRVVLTNGGLQALTLLTRHLAPGREVILEDPTYEVAERLFRESGASLLPTAVDGQGMSLQNLEGQLARGEKPAFLYTIPTFQNPTGQTMPKDRRVEFVEMVGKRGITVVEDDPYALNRFEGEAIPAIFDWYEKRPIYLSSFSNMIAPGLRVGWMIVPNELAGDLTEAAASTYITPSLVSQAIVHEFIARGSFEPNLQRVNEQLKLRRDAMIAALERHLPGATWIRPEGGFYLWIELPGYVNAREVLERAEGVTATDGLVFNSPAYMMRLAYSFASPDEIETGIERLAAAHTRTVAELEA